MSSKQNIYTLPEQFLHDTSVPARWRIWAILNGFFINGQKCWASNEWFAKQLKLHKDSVSQAMKELEDSGVIKCERTRRTRLVTPVLKTPPEIGVDAYQKPGSTPISDRRQHLSISVSNSKSRKDFPSKEKSLLSEKNSTQLAEETREVDGDGMPLPPRRQAGGGQKRNAEIMSLTRRCVAMMAKELGVTAVWGGKEYAAVARARKTISNGDILSMVEDAIASGAAEKQGMSLNAILSDNQINKYRLENQ